MTDIVERLRQGAGHEPVDIMEAEKTMDEAADVIERLREHVEALRLVATSHEPEALRLQADNERLQATLRAIVIEMPSDSAERLRRIARAALEPKP